MLTANEGSVILNPRHVERIEMERRIRQGAVFVSDPDFRVLAYTPDDCYRLTGWMQLSEASEELQRAGGIISQM